MNMNRVSMDDKVYICQMVGNLTGLQMVYLKGEDVIYQMSPVHFSANPLDLHREILLELQQEIGYYVTEEFLYYGFLHVGDETLIIGPTSEVPLSHAMIRKVALALNLTGNAHKAFEQEIQSLVCLPISTTIQILCALYFALTKKKISVKDVEIINETMEEIRTETVKSQSESRDFISPSEITHNSYSIEQTMLGFIENGDMAGLQDWISHVPSIRPGILAANHLRQMKNTFIVATTLASRAAINGGLNIDDALSLSDLYIKKCETLEVADRIMNLQLHMIMDFTSQVQSLRLGDTPSALVLRVTNYVRHHITERITTSDLADALYLSRSYLSTVFKKETGMSLANYISATKIEEAKRLLQSTDKSMATISSSLGFSSQSQFSTTFLRFTGESPRDYRKG